MSSTKIEWSSKFKNIKRPSINFKNPISSKEKDGNTENKTVVHKSLINYYIKNQNSQFPQWLVENDEKHNINSFSPTSSITTVSSNDTFSNRPPTSNYNRNSKNRFSYERTLTPASASLQSLYTKNSSSTISSNNSPSQGQGQGQYQFTQQSTHAFSQQNPDNSNNRYSTSSLQFKEKFMGQRNRQSFQLDSYSYNSRSTEKQLSSKIKASWSLLKK
ncbi:uncharacterized protein ASCRUDRAFT_74322 [Ascoidea rubescens DSM 1968]|uniref:Mso1 N-terminal domain-containing protein n=1 Tax=Ascoidea rubescens DSM 1968 TaxID=1344418 RepID=A0A1D2VMM5_9ASCO|nr:hypothetical protein ASCRUDRAFT_74322 [Ascoidea rubescens DSM 1968]ODV62868.1 hypothetical protein ASCRUDRAFT_74322 [Ascoidea rubescens DSM 1968]